MILVYEDLSVRDFLLKIIVHAGLGNLNSAAPVAGAEELAAVGIRNALTVHCHHIIVESRN